MDVFWPWRVSDQAQTMIGEGHWQQASSDLSRPILPVYGDGFSLEEGPPDAAFRWCKSRAEPATGALGAHLRMVELEFEADRLATEPAPRGRLAIWQETISRWATACSGFICDWRHSRGHAAAISLRWGSSQGLD